MGIEKGKEVEVQSEGIGNLCSNIIAENFPNFEKGSKIQIEEAYRSSNCKEQKRNTPMHIIIKQSVYRTKKEYQKLQKRKDKSHIKGNPLE
jgi:hypothetical protein